MTNSERAFMAIVDKYARSLSDYDRGITEVFALGAYRAGYRAGQEEQPPREAQGHRARSAQRRRHSDTQQQYPQR